MGSQHGGGIVLVGGVIARGPVPSVVAATAAISADEPGLDATQPLRAERAKHPAAQISLFMSIGRLLDAFTASVAAGIGGLRRDEMHTAFWRDDPQRQT
jgi:hypothetical protein